MKRIAVLAGAALACAAVALAGCSSTGDKAFNSTIMTLSKAYAHCHHGVTYHVTAGALNPGSGVDIQGQIDCPAIPGVGPTGRPLPLPPATSGLTVPPTGTAIETPAGPLAPPSG